MSYVAHSYVCSPQRSPSMCDINANLGDIWGDAGPGGLLQFSPCPTACPSVSNWTLALIDYMGNSLATWAFTDLQPYNYTSQNSSTPVMLSVAYSMKTVTIGLELPIKITLYTAFQSLSQGGLPHVAPTVTLLQDTLNFYARSGNMYWMYGVVAALFLVVTLAVTRLLSSI